MADFEVDVPISIKGGTVAGGSGGSGGSGGAEKELKELNRGVKKLDKTMILNIDIIEILSSLVGDLFKVLQPLFKILSLLFVVIFLPLIPIMKMLVEAIASVIKGLVKVFGGELDLKTFITDFLGPALLQIATGLLMAIGKILFGIIAFLGSLISLILDGIVFLGKQIGELALWIWDWVVKGFQALGDLSVRIWGLIKGLFEGVINVLSVVWEFIKSLFKGTINVVSNVWDFIKSLFRGTINVASQVWEWFKGLFGGGSRGGGGVQSDFISRPGQAPVAFSPNDTIIGVKDVSKLGGSVTININKPVVRNESDIKALANEVGRALQRQLNGRISSG